MEDDKQAEWRQRCTCLHGALPTYERTSAIQDFGFSVVCILWQMYVLQHNKYLLLSHACGTELTLGVQVQGEIFPAERGCFSMDPVMNLSAFGSGWLGLTIGRLGSCLVRGHV